MDNTQLMLLKNRRRCIKYHELLILIFLLALFSCENHNSDHELDSRIHQLMKKKDYVKATKIVDSLIEKDKNNGMYYFDKGMIELTLENFKNSNQYFKKAYYLNYKRNDCIEMIQFSKKLDVIKTEYKHAGTDSERGFYNQKDTVIH